MIVPMKKVSLIVLNNDKDEVLKKLRKLGLVHIDVTESSSTRILELQAQIASLENAAYVVEESVDKTTVMKEASKEEALALAEKIEALQAEQQKCTAQILAYQTEYERVKAWGEINPSDLAWLAGKGIEVVLCEAAPAEFANIGDELKTIVLERTKTTVRFLAVADEETDILKKFKIQLPEMSTSEIKATINKFEESKELTQKELKSYGEYAKSFKDAVAVLKKEIQFETYSSGMGEEALSETGGVKIAYFVGYIPSEDLDKLKDLAKENAWGLIAEDPTEEDDVPTKLENNKFVSLIYPITDFMGSVPGYFETDISGWFLGFILLFVAIIFGDGGYGLLITGAAVALILMNKKKGGEIQPAFVLMLLIGLATIVWGTVTCTWFGMDATTLPEFIQKLSIPVISNVYGDKIWYPFWTNGAAGLTTAQNIQILCFSVAVIHLTIAHVTGLINSKGSLKMLGELGSIMQLVGMFYVVLSLVVNGQVFPLGLTIGGIPVGLIEVSLVGIGFVLSFVFSNYEGNIVESILASVKDIVSVLLGVVNVFADIVSYIRLWAVGLAGSAISATVNDLAGPMFGKMVFVIFAVFILVFGHGLNMILNVLSVIVHGIRLNTLEYSNHVGLSWSGHKYEPFEE